MKTLNPSFNHIAIVPILEQRDSLCDCLGVYFMVKRKNLTGLVFGRLTVIEYSYTKKNHGYWKCKCSCGTISHIAATSLISGKSTTCGCGRREKVSEWITKRNTKHGLSKRSEAKKNKLSMIWSSMKARCYCETNKAYKNYGGRGISICNEWKNDLKSFHDWSIENGYIEGLTIERIDNDGNYKPSNCAWIPFSEQCNNKRSSIRINDNGVIKTIIQASIDHNLTYTCLIQRLRKGLGHFEALNTPIKSKTK